MTRARARRTARPTAREHSQAGAASPEIRGLFFFGRYRGIVNPTPENKPRDRKRTTKRLGRWFTRRERRKDQAFLCRGSRGLPLQERVVSPAVVVEGTKTSPQKRRTTPRNPQKAREMQSRGRLGQRCVWRVHNSRNRCDACRARWSHDLWLLLWLGATFLRNIRA